MGNCLVTKLKSVVNNNSLEYLGYVSIDTTGNSGLTKFILSAAGVVKVLNGTVGGNNEFNVTANNDKYVVNYGAVSINEGFDAVTLLIPKYNIDTLIYANGATVNMNAFDLSNLKRLNTGNNATIIVNQEVFNSLERIIMNGAGTTLSEDLDFTSLGLGGTLAYLTCPITDSHCKGSLDNLGLSDVVSPIYVPGTKTVSLTIEQFVANHVISGRTEKTYSLPWVGACYCKFNDTEVAKQESNTLSWEPSNGNTLITFNGNTTTIHVNSNGTWTRVS